MRIGLFWLNDKQWAQMEPHLPTNQTGPARDALSAVSFTCFSAAHAGAIARRTMVLTRRSTIGSIAGLSGHWQAIFEALARCGKDGVTLSIDSTSIKAHRSASGGKGGHEQAIGRSRGGLTTKIHALSDPDCRPCAFHLTPGQDADIAAGPALLKLAPPISTLIGDKGYDGDGFRA